MNAYREMTEEIGIVGFDIDELQFYGTHEHETEDGEVRLFCNIYKAELNLPVDYQIEFNKKEI